MQWLDISLGTFMFDIDCVLGRSIITREDFAVFEIELCVFVVIKLFSMKDLILALRLEGLGGAKSCTNLFRPYKKLSYFSIFYASCTMLSVSKLTFLFWFVDRLFI